MTVREVLQWIGTELFRENMHKDFWVRATINRIDSDKSFYDKFNGGEIFHNTFENVYFVTDVRFPNEVEAIRSAGGIVIRIYRSGCAGANDTHPSETSLDHADRDSFFGQSIFWKEKPNTRSNTYKATSVMAREKNNKLLAFDYSIDNDIDDLFILKDAAKKLLAFAKIE